jgi:hypothetical protein
MSKDTAKVPLDLEAKRVTAEQRSRYEVLGWTGLQHCSLLRRCVLQFR